MFQQVDDSGKALCSACWDIFSGCVNNRYRPFDLPVQIRHHEPPGNFIAAARDGCSFCLSLMKEIEKRQKYKEGSVKADDLVTDYVLYFTKDPPRKLHKLQFWVLDSSSDLALVLQFEFYLKAKKHLKSSIDICICDDGASKSLSNPGPTSMGFPSQPNQKSLRDEVSRNDVVNHWINKCARTHQACNAGLFEYSFFPTRVIDVGESGDTSWRIVCYDSVSELSPKYVTLSHRWKPQNTRVKLLSSNVADMRQGFPDTKLSNNFRTAMNMARDLRVRYLWIDCLCIIQDSRNDWETESQKMCEVYANSYLNFAAADVTASDNKEYSAGISYSPLYVFPIRLLWCGHPREYMSTSMLKNWWQNCIEDLPILRRGWIFQERFLSPRMLYFDHHELFWQCRELKASETVPSGVLDSMYPGTPHKSLDYLYGRQSSKPDASRPVDIYSNWRSTVTTYSSCQLTRFSDRLSAVGGIAKLFRKNIGSEYLAGVWRTDIEQGLSWWPEGAQCSFDDFERTLFPTWSWASHNGPISWRSLPRTEDITSMVELHEAFTTDFHGKRISDSKAPDNPMMLKGIIKPLSIDVKARMKINRQILKPFGIEFDRYQSFSSLDAFCLPLWVIVLRDYPDVEVRHLECLIISRLDKNNSKDRFKRIGIVSFKMKSAQRINDIFGVSIEDPMKGLADKWKLISIV